MNILNGNMHARTNFSILVLLSTFSILLYIGGSEYDDNSIFIEHSLELTQSLNLNRQELIQERCRQFPPQTSLDALDPRELEHILVDDDHKLLYCYVPKVACTNWKRILMVLTGKWNSTDPLSIPANLPHIVGTFRNMSSVPKVERDYMLENYHKMLIVRNPFERLLSAYRNKLEGSTDSAKYFQCTIKNKERKLVHQTLKSHRNIKPLWVCDMKIINRFNIN